MDDRWFRILSYWQDHEHKHSLTFPFLIGALREPVGSTRGYENGARAELEELIDAIRSHAAADYILNVYRCGDRDKLVITRVRGTMPPPFAVAIPPVAAGESPVLFSSAEAATTNVPIASLVEAIWREGSDAIEQGLFSCRGRLFQPFDEHELKVIRAALV
jgi:hypothetical protein